MTFTRQLLRDSWHSWIAQDMCRVGPLWLQWLWTALFSAGLALVFTLLGFLMLGPRASTWGSADQWLFWYGKNFVVSLTIGGFIHIAFEVGGRLIGGATVLRQLKGWRATVFFAGIPMLGVVTGWPIGLLLAGVDVHRWFTGEHGTNLLITTALLSVGLSLGLHLYFSARAKQIEADKRATEAQLRLLQAQMEPHFLFNTLANVLSLIEHDTPKARQMLEAFTDYLRASLAGLRRDECPLGDELDLADAYLRLMQVRMEDRLQFTITADDSARRALLPPLLLQPLVENAVLHGLEPKLQGGTVQVLAQVQPSETGPCLVVTVSDDGVGLGASLQVGAGLALRNTRQRLTSRYGNAATLDVQTQSQTQTEERGLGTRATLRLPLSSSAP